ncbi:sigma-54-dependent transcriptional regulator [Aureliella helgolandensis]|nr:sigma-54 dependent transcriptional regulator [Aureliella helgolandensis]
MTETPMKILLVEDEDDFRNSCVRWMLRKGYEPTGASSAAEALSLLDRASFDVGVFDMNMPGMSGLELLQRISQDKIEIEVIMLTGQGTIETAVSAMKMGACDFLSKPCSLGDLENHCLMARERGELRKENKQLKAVISRQRPTAKLIGDSRQMRDLSRMIDKIAPTDKPVLLEGESGTGKEVVARLIQQASPLRDQPFVTINCAALPENLVESELFGHQKGSFTGATAEKPGLFEIADGGTIFIDEIGELPLALQPKLLRVLEDGSMRRVGCHRERRVSVRVIAATNRDLASEVKAGNFREDLYYRVNVLSLVLPPLREREGDVDRLLEHYLPPPWHVEPAVRDCLNRYPWPGNIRQLINVIQRATILADNHDITLDDLPTELTDFEGGAMPKLGRAPNTATEDQDLKQAELRNKQAVLGEPEFALDEVARMHVLEVLRRENGNKASAARKLRIHRRKLYRLLERYSQPDDGDRDSITTSILG